MTAHHLFWGHCVKSEVIFLDRGIFLRERSSRRKIPRSKTITDEFTQWPKQRWCKVLLSLITATLTISCVVCVFFNKNTKKTAFFIISVLIPVNEFQSVQTWWSLHECDKCENTGCIARDCLCVYVYARMALAMIPTSHAEVIITSHCYVIMTAQFFAPNW